MPDTAFRWATPVVVSVLVVVGAVLGTQAPAVAAGLAAVGVLASAALARGGRTSVVGALVVMSVVGALCAENPSNVGLFALCLLVAWGAVVSGWRLAVLLGLASYLVLLAGVLWVSEDGGWAAWFAATLVTAAVGVLTRRERTLMQALREAQADLAERSAAAERQRIARELHDVIGHALTVSALHISSARLALDDDPEEARAALLEAERLSRQSLAEVRSAVGLLRDDAAPAHPAAPLPGIDDVGSLVESFRRAGADVTVEVSGDLSALTSTGGLTAYRILQEALTNATRHAPGRAAVVRLAVSGGTASVVVHSAGPADAAWTPGSGVAGMRERAEALGGHLVAGPVGDGWRVEAVLPA